MSQMGLEKAYWKKPTQNESRVNLNVMIQKHIQHPVKQLLTIFLKVPSSMFDWVLNTPERCT